MMMMVMMMKPNNDDDGDDGDDEMIMVMVLLMMKARTSHRQGSPLISVFSWKDEGRSLLCRLKRGRLAKDDMPSVVSDKCVRPIVRCAKGGLSSVASDKCVWPRQC